MVKWIKDNKGLSSLLSIVIALPMFWGIYSAGKSFKREFEEYLVVCIDDRLKERKSGFRSEIAKKLSIDRENVVDFVCGIIDESQETIRVGIIVKRDKPTKFLFINTDGLEYPATNADNTWYYWDENSSGNNKWKVCF